MGALFSAFILFVILTFCFVIILITTVSMWKIYVKAGEKGWKFLIPVYNYIVLLRFVKRPLTWLIPVVAYVIFYILFFIYPDSLAIKILMLSSSIIYLVYAIMSCHALSKAFGKGVGYTVGLCLIPIIFVVILAFGDAEYQYEVNQCQDPKPSEIE